MTRTEAEFFKLLLLAVGDEYHVYPQVHLSAIIDHKVEGQNWKAAFNHINAKSVDFVICDKQNFRPLVAIELDDSSHARYDRRLRDDEVERVFEEANLRLVRFSTSKSYASDEIAQLIGL